jgi:hypothetical protein
MQQDSVQSPIHVDSDFVPSDDPNVRVRGPFLSVWITTVIAPSLTRLTFKPACAFTGAEVFSGDRSRSWCCRFRIALQTRAEVCERRS